MCAAEYLEYIWMEINIFTTYYYFIAHTRNKLAQQLCRCAEGSHIHQYV